MAQGVEARSSRGASGFYRFSPDIREPGAPDRFSPRVGEYKSGIARWLVSKVGRELVESRPRRTD
jgi:hypothetical protein